MNYINLDFLAPNVCVRFFYTELYAKFWNHTTIFQIVSPGGREVPNNNFFVGGGGLLIFCGLFLVEN